MAYANRFEDSLAKAQSDRLAENWSGATEHARAALAIAEAGGDLAEIARAQGTLGLLRMHVDHSEASALLRSALKTARPLAASAPRLVARLELDLGSLLAMNGAFDEAAAHFDRAAARSRAAGAAALARSAETNAARAWLDSGDPDAATEKLLGATRRAEPDGAASEPISLLLSRGEIARRILQAAPSHPRRKELLLEGHRVYAGALDIARATLDPASEARALERLAEFYEFDGRRAEAIALTRQAIQRAEATKTPEAHWTARALLGRLFFRNDQPTRAISEYQAALDGIISTEPSASNDAFNGTAQVYLEYVDLLLRRAETEQVSARQEGDLRLAQRIMERRKAAELRDYFRDECVDAYQGRSQDSRSVSAKALVVYPILLPDRLSLLVSGAGFIRQYVVPVPGDRVTEEARTFRQLVVKRVTNQYRRHARQLYQWLIAPLAADLERTQADTIVFVPSGALLAIPFAALMNGDEFLIERFAIGVIPGLELTDPRPIGGEALDVLAAGLTEPVQGYAALPNVAAEIEAIAGLYSAEVLMNEAFSAERIQASVQARPFDIIHIASHAEFGTESRDAFVLTHDGRLSIDQLASLISRFKFRDRPLEMIALSACDTAGGNERAALGLVGMAIKSGARSALGSLWAVNDEAASQLVQSVYRGLQAPGVSRAQALQNAQRELLGDLRFRHPGYWSAFILVSNWL